MSQQDIQVKRFNAILGRLLGMAGVEDPAGALSPEISPVLVLENDRPEWLFLSNQFPMAAGGVETASVANPTFFRIRNPVGSGIIAVIEAVNLSASIIITDGVAQLGTQTVDMGGAMAPLVRDNRYGQIVGSCTVSESNGGGSGTGIERFRVPINTVYNYQNLPIILKPGTNYDWGVNDVNVEVHANIRWRERPAEPYELA
jgi:hypothetical protein